LKIGQINISIVGVLSFECYEGRDCGRISRKQVTLLFQKKMRAAPGRKMEIKSQSGFIFSAYLSLLFIVRSSISLLKHAQNNFSHPNAYIML
jgi:hypothetical protein